MADPRTFTLIGEFKDGITPELAKINKELAALKASFSGIGSRKNTGFRGATQEIGKLVSAHKKLSDSVRGVQSDLRSTVGVLHQYRREMGKAAAATRAFQKAGGTLGGRQFTQNMESANRSAQAYLKTLKQINAEAARTPRMPRGGGGGGGVRPPSPPRGGTGGMGGVPGQGSYNRSGRSGGGGMQAHMGEFGFAYSLGTSVAQPIQNAIVAGFQIGTDLMMKPFQYFAGAFGERVQDQISDLKAAGGFLSISRRSENPFIKNIDEAIQFQQDTNRTFAKMAADLPGVTNDYVQVGKRLGDTAARIVGSDFKKSVEEANRIRATEEGGKFYGPQITGTGAKAQRETITTLLGELTKKTTLAGMGGRSGAGGISGAYGLPGLTERMISQDEVSMGQFQRYSAVFSDPTISDALARNIENINKTQKNSLDRYKALNKLLDEVVTPDLIAKLRTSVDGIYQGLKSAIFDPDTGLFGLGRQFKGVAKKVNDLGQYVDEFGNVVSDISKAINDDLSVFEMVSQIFSQVGQVLTPIVENIGYVFDPMQKVASLLVKARHYTAEFARTFNNYVAGLENLSKQKGFEYIKTDGFLRLRASLGAINNLLVNVGAISEGQFAANAEALKAKDIQKNLGSLMKTMLDQLLNSKVANEIGLFIGELIGTVISEVAKVTGLISGRMQSSNQLVEGIKKGFEKAGGPAAFTNIFRDVFTAMLHALVGLLKILPLEAYLIGAAALITPAMVQGLAMSAASRLWGGVQGLTGKVVNTVMEGLKNQATRMTNVEPALITDLGSVITDPRRMLPAAPGSAPGAIVPSTGAGAAGGAFSGAISKLLLVLGKLTLVLLAITVIGGGVESTLRQLGQFFGELGHSISGAFGGLFDLLGVLGGFVGDVGRRFGDLIAPTFGLSSGFDGLKLVLAPITLAFQALSMGLRGLALAFAELRVFLARITGDREYQKRIQERDKMAADLSADRGRINAYNASMLGPEALKKQLNDAVFELQNSTTLKAARSAELKAFIAEARGQRATAPAAAPKPAITITPPPAPPSPQLTPIATSTSVTAAATTRTGGSTAATAATTAQINQKTSNQISILSAIRSVMGTLGGKLDSIRAITVEQTTAIRAGNMGVIAAINAAAAQGMFGGMGGGMGLGPGMGGAGVQVAGALGNFIKQTGGAPGSIHEHPQHGGVKGKHSSGSYHYSGRAIDIGAYANEQAGVISRVQQFNAKNGVRPVEFLHAGNDPKGHSDHVHVAYALGKGNPAFFSSQNAAERWEASMAGSMNVRSVTGNTMEGFGGSNVGDIYVTVNAGSTSDPDQLAYMVAERIQQAVGDAVNASILV